MPNLAFDVHMLELEIERLMQDCPELADDEQLRADMIEGETDALGVLDRIVGYILERKTSAEAQASRIGELQARKAATERGESAFRRMAHRLMVAGEMKTAKLTEKTLTRAKGRDSVEITDEAALPSWAYKVEVVRNPSKTAISDAIKAGIPVPGAQIKAGDEVLRVA